MKRDYNAFYEYQKLKRWPVLLIFVPVNLLLITNCIMQIGLGKPWRNNPIPYEGLIILTMMMLLFMVIMLYVNMETIVNKDGIHIRMRLFPFYTKSKFFLWEDISEVAIKKYHPFRTFGGWGIRMGSGSLILSSEKMKSSPIKSFISGVNSAAYTMSGNTGIRFVFKNKKIVLIGTDKPEELLEAFRALGKSESNKE